MKIGIFDSGYGGLTILEQIRALLPQYDYLYLGDNARAPYGNHSFELIYRYTWQAVQYLLDQDCSLIILACNTASAKALRTIQQHDLPLWRHAHPERSSVVLTTETTNTKTTNTETTNTAQTTNVQTATATTSPNTLCPTLPNVLGIIRPTIERIASYTRNGHIGVLGTIGTIQSNSYPIELAKSHPHLLISQQPCPMWVPLIENGEHTSPGADYFVDKYIRLLYAQDPLIDTLILGCTHYPMLLDKISLALSRLVPHHVEIVVQGAIVAQSLQDYLLRHPEISSTLSLSGTCQYLTSEHPSKFSQSATLFLHPSPTPSADNTNNTDNITNTTPTDTTPIQAHQIHW